MEYQDLETISIALKQSNISYRRASGVVASAIPYQHDQAQANQMMDVVAWRISLQSETNLSVGVSDSPAEPEDQEELIDYDDD